MKVRRLIRLTAALLVVAVGTWGMAADDDEEPRLQDKVVLNTPDIVSSDYVAFSPDSKKLLTFGVGDGRARLWDVAGEKQIAVFRHGNTITFLDFRKRRVTIPSDVCAAAFSPDGKTIATAETDAEIWLWDAGSGKKITSFAGHKDINALLYSGDGKKLSAAVRGELRVYDVKDGRLLRSRNIDPRKRRGWPRPVTASYAMKRPMMGFGTELYDAATGDLCNRLMGDVGGLFACTAITADQRKVATCGTSTIRIWDTKAEDQDRGKPKDLAFEHLSVKVRCLAFSPNDKILAAGFKYDPPPPGVGGGRGGVLLIDVSSGKLLENHDAGIAAVRSLAFSPDGRLLATGDRDWTIKLWDVPTAWRKKDK